ncbi:MAG: hypothetical protein FJX46_13020 [Alphaproteobacteria bacterium]|nr:hypothetical protein [Alphaproteobacteria bacterium]
MAAIDYDRSVFINCPFDRRYEPLFRAIVFAVIDCGYVARCALEDSDSGVVRIDKIAGLIDQCRFGIHDLSRTGLDPKSRLPRFNMPFELGLFLGAKRFGSKRQSRKLALILDTHRYRYQKFLSDIAGQDVVAHGNDRRRCIVAIRHWLASKTHDRQIPGAKKIVARYIGFDTALPDLCRRAHTDVADLTFGDYAKFIAAWIERVG